LAYSLKWDKPSTGKISDNSWFEALKQEGWKGKTPVDDKPELEDDNIDFWRAFWELDTCRPTGMSIGQIPVTSIYHWLNEEEIKCIEHRVFYKYIILQMDRFFIQSIQEKKPDGTRNRNRNLHRQPKGEGRRARSQPSV
jgi:hypothetical protein